MSRQFAISDVHGCAKTFKTLVENQLRPNIGDEFMFLGDYIHKGPDSKGVINYILELQNQGFKTHCLMGNHEEVLLSCFEDEELYEQWKENDKWGKVFLESYKMKSIRELPDDHLAFFQSLYYWAETENYIFVHAGLNFREFDIFSDRAAMLRARGYEVDPAKTKGRQLVHGHTPTPLPKLMNAFKSDSYDLNLDNGCAYNHQKMGNLLAFECRNKEVFIQKRLDEIN